MSWVGVDWATTQGAANAPSVTSPAKGPVQVNDLLVVVTLVLDTGAVPTLNLASDSAGNMFQNLIPQTRGTGIFSNYYFRVDYATVTIPTASDTFTGSFTNGVTT